jgi:hypothetical protein
VEPPPKLEPASQPIVIKQPEPVPGFRWYYLFPLGIGQFAAGSPVRGTMFMVLQAGFLAMNIASYYVMYQSEAIAGGGFRDVARAKTGLLLTDIAFAGLIASVIAGIVDAVCCE